MGGASGGDCPRGGAARAWGNDCARSHIRPGATDRGAPNSSDCCRDGTAHARGGGSAGSSRIRCSRERGENPTRMRAWESRDPHIGAPARVRAVPALGATPAGRSGAMPRRQSGFPEVEWRSTRPLPYRTLAPPVPPRAPDDQPRPIEAKRSERSSLQVAPFSALQVGVEDKPALIDGLDEHHARRRASVLSDGRQRSRVGLLGGGLLDQSIQRAELLNRILGGHLARITKNKRRRFFRLPLRARHRYRKGGSGPHC